MVLRAAAKIQVWEMGVWKMTEGFEQTMPDLVGTRMLVVDRLFKEPNALWTKKERHAVENVAYSRIYEWQQANPQDEWRSHEAFRIIARDLEDFPLDIPKWVMLQQWLCPESAAKEEPGLAWQLATLAMSGELEKHADDKVKPPPLWPKRKESKDNE